MLCYVMLSYVILCYVMSCYVMLCYVLCYVMLCYIMLCYVMLCYVMFYVMFYVMSCNVMLCYVMLCYVIPGHCTECFTCFYSLVLITSLLSVVESSTIELAHVASEVKAGISVFSLNGWHDLQRIVLRLKLHSNCNSLLNTWYTDEGI
jgi:hypothetical protein